jgi:hypothetical protein
VHTETIVLAARGFDCAAAAAPSGGYPMAAFGQVVDQRMIAWLMWAAVALICAGIWIRFCMTDY